MVSGMLTAIRDFVQDSFKVATTDSLEALKVGELSVWIEPGPHAIVAAVIRGTAPPDFRGRLQEAVESIHLQFGEVLEAFDGDTAPLADAQEHARSVPALPSTARTNGSRARAARGSSPRSWRSRCSCGVGFAGATRIAGPAI